MHEQLSTSRAPFERVTWPTQQPSLPTATHPRNSLKTCPGLPTTCESCTRTHCGPHASTHRRCNRPTSTHNPGSALPSDQCSSTTSQHATPEICNRPSSARNPVGTIVRHTANVRPQPVSTQPAHRGNATARSQHTTPAMCRLSANAHLQLAGTQPTTKDIATARRQRATHVVGRHTTNVRPLLVSTQPAHKGNATARRQHTTLAVGRATHSVHLYTYPGCGHHGMCTKPCQDASTPQPVSTQPAPSGDAS